MESENVTGFQYTTYLPFTIILLLCSALLLFNPFGLNNDALYTLCIALFVVGFWTSEILPMPITSLLPLILFPLFKLSTINEVCISYSDPIIFLFMGGFFLAIAIEKWNLHKRIALNIINFTGLQNNRILLGFMLSTFFISMWISNTATTMMMYPIGLSIIKVLGHSNSVINTRNFSIAIMLSIAYASNIGGLATLVGTPPNSAYAAYMNSSHHNSIGFLDWMLIGTPIALVLLVLIYFLFAYVLFPCKLNSTSETKKYLSNELQKIGPWSFQEKVVTIIFCITAFLWITKDIFNKFLGLNLNDTLISLLGASLLFIIPSKLPNKDAAFEIDETSIKSSRILNWEDTHNMAWGILLLFGGGLALAKQLEEVGLLNMIGKFVQSSSDQNLFLLILITASITIFLSEVMSNIAQVIVFSPIVTAIAISAGISPLYLGIPMCLASSCAGMLPMGTPPNAIVFGSRLIPLRSMLKAGFLVNILSVLMISLLCYLLLPFIFKL